MVTENKPATRKPVNGFKKGVSGNPGGRPKVEGKVKELARAYTEQAIRTLGDILGNEDENARARIAAAEVLLDRAWGKAIQATTLSNEDGSPLFTGIQVTLVRPAA